MAPKILVAKVSKSDSFGLRSLLTLDSTLQMSWPAVESASTRT